MMFALGLHSAQVREDWLLLRSKGNGARQGAAEIESFEFAGYCARKIGLELGHAYGMEDLICFLCLTQCG